YNSLGQTTSYTVKSSDAQGTFSSWYDYSNRTYNSSGSVTSYDWVKKDQSGNVISSGHWQA
ncbi:MAG: hypothetical protein PHJ00_06250, partial [Candidatus Omnitrophica bacterium]|nr:hypothetical protein [Candidatus Omnitrophota bacterium]